MTSAPKSLRTVAAAGPAIQLARSTTCSPCRSGALSVMESPLARTWKEGVLTGDIAPDEKLLDRIGALVGVDCLDVAKVTRDVVVEHDAVATEDVARRRECLARSPYVVHL